MAGEASTVAWKEVKGGGGSKNPEHTVVPNIALWNISFQWMPVVLNVFVCKESTDKSCTVCDIVY